MSLPNCHYCGKFVNPKKPGIESRDIYCAWPPGIDDTIFYHTECKKKADEAKPKKR